MARNLADFDSDLFILEVEKRPTLWDSDSPQYGLNKHLKMKAWIELCEIFYPCFQESDSTTRNEMCKALQKRWRNLRDCFARELQAQKLKSKPDRKQYKYFNQLMFLSQTIEKRKSISSREEVSIQECSIDEVKCEPESPQLTCTSRPPVETVTVQTPSVTTRKRSNEHIATEIKLLQDTSKRFAEMSAADLPTSSIALEEDEDRLFLLSLLKDVKKIHEENKLGFKSEVILLIMKWQKKGAR